MKKESLWLIVAISLLVVGCEYILTDPASVCEPPNKVVKDIYGNDVCVTPEVVALPEDTPDPTDDMTEEPGTGEETGESEEPAETDEEETDDGMSGITGGAVTDPAPPPATLPRKIVTEGEVVDFPNLQAEDPDGDPISYLFDPPLGEDGVWQTEIGDAGEYLTTITATDGTNLVTQDILIVVLPANQPPVISGLLDRYVIDEGDTITFDPVVTDPDGDEVTVTYSGWMTQRTKRAGFNDAGVHIVTITATDGTSQTTKRVVVEVMNINRPPVMSPLDDLQVMVGEEVIMTPTATDPDGDDIIFLYSPPLDADGRWTPEQGDDGDYVITVTATDGDLSDSTSFTLRVGTPNLPPIMQPLDDIEVREGEMVIIRPVAVDPEGEDVIFTYSGWMTQSTYQTTYDDAGSYSVTVTASDGVNEVSQTIRIFVEDVNRPPVFNPGAFD